MTYCSHHSSIRSDINPAVYFINLQQINRLRVTTEKHDDWIGHTYKHHGSQAYTIVQMALHTG